MDWFSLLNSSHDPQSLLSLCSLFSCLMFRTELFPHSLLLLESSPCHHSVFWKGKKPCVIFKSPLYPTPHKPFVSKSCWFYLQNAFRMRMFSLSPTENSLAQDFFILYLNNCKISLSYLTAHVLPFLPPSLPQPNQFSTAQPNWSF